jgi:hypothetical protein
LTRSKVLFFLCASVVELFWFVGEVFCSWIHRKLNCCLSWKWVVKCESSEETNHFIPSPSLFVF